MTSQQSDTEAQVLVPKEGGSRAALYYGAGIIAAALVGALVLTQTGAVEFVITRVAEGVAEPTFWTAAGVGLLAQVVDGALGMAYGITATSFLLSTGTPPAVASASVHLAEVFTTGFSGLSHWKLGNVSSALFKRLVLPGVSGALLGSYVLTSVDGKALKPWIWSYLLLMGLYIIVKAFRRITVRTEPPTYVAPLALFGGFVDSVGGGGWGPVVATSLLSSGQEPRRTIGSVNAAEFFIAAASGLSLTVMGGLTGWATIAGLVIGGMFAAPLAAVLTRHAPTRVLMIVVGCLITGLGIYNLAPLF